MIAINWLIVKYTIKIDWLLNKILIIWLFVNYN